MKRATLLALTVSACLLTGCTNALKDGTGYLEDGNYKEAVTAFQKAVDEGKKTAEAYRGLGMAYYEQEDYASARDAFEKAFPDKILENKRVYYDDIYDQDDSISYIKDVHFERKNDNYLSGLEYLSSIILLSRCTALVGGNCGGTLGALFFNDEKHKKNNIFKVLIYFTLKLSTISTLYMHKN